MLSFNKLMVICMISPFNLDGYHTENFWKVVDQGQTSGEKALELVGLREASKGCGNCRLGPKGLVERSRLISGTRCAP
jgi:hypothetical protein